MVSLVCVIVLSFLALLSYNNMEIKSVGIYLWIITALALPGAIMEMISDIKDLFQNRNFKIDGVKQERKTDDQKKLVLNDKKSNERNVHYEAGEEIPIEEECRLKSINLQEDSEEQQELVETEVIKYSKKKKLQVDEEEKCHDDVQLDDIQLNEKKLESDSDEVQSRFKRAVKEYCRKIELRNKFFYSHKSGFQFAYAGDYYPKAWYSDDKITLEQKIFRENVWRFKDGCFDIGIDVLSDFCDGMFKNEEMGNITLCVIPASTGSKNRARFASVCNALSQKFNLKNGYDLIEILWDRDDSRHQKNCDKLANLGFSASMAGRDIILFDDVITSGDSFVQIARQMMDMGAKRVRGIFIGKTVSCNRNRFNKPSYHDPWRFFVMPISEREIH